MENDDAVQIETWTSASIGSPANASSLVIYALVTLGKRPVSGTDLIAHLTGDNITQPLTLRLSENSAHDVTLNDGIYSAVVMNLPPYSTSFSYVVEAVNNSGKIATGVNTRNFQRIRRYDRLTRPSWKSRDCWKRTSTEKSHECRTVQALRIRRKLLLSTAFRQW